MLKKKKNEKEEEEEEEGYLHFFLVGMKYAYLY